MIGLGLIGGSLLRAASAVGREAWGATASEADAQAAAADGFDVSTDVDAALRRAADQDALVVLAVPLTVVDEVLRTVGACAPRCLLTDVASVKSPVLRAARSFAPETRFVGGHPMAGTAESGWRAGNSALFGGAAWVACVEDDTDLAAWAEVARLALDVGAHVVPLTAAAHDEAAARISHLPHLLAAVLATVGAQGGPVPMALAAGSYTDGTRVAGTRPELVRAMTEGNREALLPVLDEALGRLGAMRGSLASTGGLAATIKAGYEGAQAFAQAREATPAGVRVNLAAPEARAGLRALGERGGRVTAITDETAIGEVA
ncbi:prephenate dehydrogenase [Amycolatopsis acidiphila]|uniref:Prephenate dehydrogenase n=1 Tax=Amycolatopsis acidiphila TaxID=715473 RepID=A0A558ANA2_9PSEU|nr:prephenate dehydrogenase [Amycolatopsis acidiphila]TVT25743.1 prephenate dehydrogenase [Amycolatopsis acidiphila]UIJ64169.1 prephenate dehydrogenase [Amycolatopsis acidiphila]